MICTFHLFKTFWKCYSDPFSLTVGLPQSTVLSSHNAFLGISLLPWLTEGIKTTVHSDGPDSLWRIRLSRLCRLIDIEHARQCATVLSPCIRGCTTNHNFPNRWHWSLLEKCYLLGVAEDQPQCLSELLSYYLTFACQLLASTTRKPKAAYRSVFCGPLNNACSL